MMGLGLIDQFIQWFCPIDSWYFLIILKFVHFQNIILPTLTNLSAYTGFIPVPVMPSSGGILVWNWVWSCGALGEKIVSRNYIYITI